jgi:hypothetical protein
VRRFFWRVTVRVPEDYAEDLRRFARELRTRQSAQPAAASATQWRRLSPSTEWLIDPECQARGIIRDTRALGPNRFYWRSESRALILWQEMVNCEHKWLSYKTKDEIVNL